MEFKKLNLLENTAPIVHTTAQLKGRRLRMTRALSGISRQELCEKMGITASIIDTWESGRVELTEKSAVFICATLKRMGVYCSVEWLLTGGDSPPRLMDELEKSMMDFTSSNMNVISSSENLVRANYKKIPSYLDENVRRELSFFLNLHDKAIFHIVEKDFLNSKYKVGDCVAGIESDIQKLIGKVIIGVLGDGKTIFGKLLAYSHQQCYVFFSSDRKKEALILTNACAVIWHRIANIV